MNDQTLSPLPVALTIAGSDPSGGAGIQADIKTFTVIGVYCGAVITALTCQNTMGVSSTLSQPPDFVRQQVEEVLADLCVTHIKIGMLGDEDITRALGPVLAGFKGEIIYDPVLRSTSGSSLYSAENLELVRTQMIENCTVLTPNMSELEVLTGKQYCGVDEALVGAAKLLSASGSLQAVCLKGGHIESEKELITDFLLEKKESASNREITVHKAKHQRIQTRNSHGTGCTFASAFTAFHMLTGDRKTAFDKTVYFMDALITKSSPYRIGGGKGPLLHHMWRNAEPE